MPRRLIVRLLTVLAAAALTSCTGATNTSDRDLKFVNSIEGTQIVHGRSRLLGLARPLLGTWVDPRTEREYIEGHIPGAVHLPFQDLSNDHARLRAYDILIVYGNDYNDPKAQGMSKRLLELGFPDVYTLRGGLRAWIDDEQPIDTGTPD